MGYIRHDTIIVTSQSENGDLERAHARAIEIGAQVSSLVDGSVNRQRSFFIAPDGSKEWWAESDQGDKRREEFIAWMKTETPYLDWVAVSFGGDSRSASITSHADVEEYAEESR